MLEQRGGAALDDPQLPLLHLRQVGGRVQQALDRPQDQRQRGAQLVADVGEEVALELVELADALQQRFQFRVLARDLGFGLLFGGDVAALGQQKDHLALLVPHGQQGEVHHDGLVACGLPVDLHVAADELATTRAPDEFALLLGDFARDLEPTCLPERPTADVVHRHTGAFERGPVDLQRAAINVQQTNELVHRIQHDTRELLALGLRGVCPADRHRSDLDVGGGREQGLH